MATIQQRYSIEELRKEVERMLDRLGQREPIAAAVVFEVDRAKEHAFLHLAKELASATLTMPGVRKFVYHKQRPYQPPTYPDAYQYLIYEEWDTTRSFRAQWDSPHLIHFQHRVGDLVVARPELAFYHASEGGGGGGSSHRAIVLKTGAKQCWDARGRPIDCPGKGRGQDGAVGAGEPCPDPRFVEESPGAIKDRLTNLTWLKNANRFGEVTWEEALGLAQKLSAGSHGLEDGSEAGDWRLPNIRELRSLIDYSQVDPILPEDHPFENVKSAIYWTSTSLAAAPLLAWMTTLGIGPSVFVIKSSFCRMWPVRGRHSRLARTGQTKCWDPTGAEIPGIGSGEDGDIKAGVESPNPRFVDNHGDGTVTDKLTGLVWTKNAAPFGILTWADALDACNQLADGQYGLADGSREGDWRLPNICEIESLVDYGAFPPPSLPQEAGQVFSNIRPTSYWTSTTVASAPNQAMFIILGVGPSIFENKEVPLLAWPVRDARHAR